MKKNIILCLIQVTVLELSLYRVNVVAFKIYDYGFAHGHNPRVRIQILLIFLQNPIIYHFGGKSVKYPRMISILQQNSAI